MEIREATAQDVAEIARIHVTSWRVAYAGKLPRAVVAQQSLAQRQNFGSSGIRQTGSWSPKTTGVIVGFIAGGPQRHHETLGAPYPQEVYGLYVDPAQQQRGVGYQLWQARIADWSAWTVDCLATNAVALRFYTRQGGQLVQTGNYSAGQQTFPTRVLGFHQSVPVVE
jgi:Acetyltransferases